MQAERPSLFSSPSLNAYAQPGNEPTTSDSSGGLRMRYQEEDIEFSFDCAEAVSSPIPADQIFHNGRIKPIYEPAVAAETTTRSRRKALRRLFIEERQELGTESSSASTIDELESVPSDSYCVWEPKTTKENKGNESKRWKLKDLMTRHGSEKGSRHSRSMSDDGHPSSNDKQVAARKTGMKEGGGGRRSYLPYRQELVGIFGSGRNLQRF